MNNNNSNKKIIKLTPPSFQNINYNQTSEMTHNSGNVKRTFVCLRPTHKALPRVESELIKDKIVTHNYGHGGSGWTLLFGTVQKSLDHFAIFASAQCLPCDTKITVIGAGCIGLTTAVFLKEKGYTNVEVVAEKLDDIPSYNAGGLFGIACLDLDDEKAQKNCEYFALETYRRIAQIAEGKDPLFKTGAQKCYVYAGNEKNVGPLYDSVGLDLLINRGITKPGEEVVVDFGTKKWNMIRFETFFVHTRKLMSELVRLCKERHITITQKKINSFDEIKSSVVFNCAGLGAKELTNDPILYPVAGHMVELQNQPSVEETNYIMAVKFAMTPVKTKEEIDQLPHLYYMPKGEGVVGGTFVRKYRGEDKVFNEEQFKGIVERGRAFFGTFTPKSAL